MDTRLSENINLELVPAYSHKEEVKTLFSEYTNMLIEGDSSFEDLPS